MDEAVEVAKSVCNGDMNACLLALMPVQHSSVSQSTVVEKKRSLEDKLMSPLGTVSASARVPRALEMHELSVNYTDAGHAGDRRRRHQSGCLALPSLFRSWFQERS